MMLSKSLTLAILAIFMLGIAVEASIYHSRTFIRSPIDRNLMKIGIFGGENKDVDVVEDKENELEENDLHHGQKTTPKPHRPKTTTRRHRPTTTRRHHPHKPSTKCPPHHHHTTPRHVKTTQPPVAQTTEDVESSTDF